MKKKKCSLGMNMFFCLFCNISIDDTNKQTDFFKRKKNNQKYLIFYSCSSINSLMPPSTLFLNSRGLSICLNSELSSIPITQHQSIQHLQKLQLKWITQHERNWKIWGSPLRMHVAVFFSNDVQDTSYNIANRKFFQKKKIIPTN